MRDPPDFIEESRIMRKLRTYACRLRVADRADERDMIRMFAVWWTGVTVYWIGGLIGSSPSPTPTGAGIGAHCEWSVSAV